MGLVEYKSLSRSTSLILYILLLLVYRTIQLDNSVLFASVIAYKKATAYMFVTIYVRMLSFACIYSSKSTV